MFNFSSSVVLSANGSGIAEVGGDPATAGVKPPNEAEKAAYFCNTDVGRSTGYCNRVLLNYPSRRNAIKKPGS